VRAAYYVTIFSHFVMFALVMQLVMPALVSFSNFWVLAVTTSRYYVVCTPQFL
jgi:hypothetical protein